MHAAEIVELFVAATDRLRAQGWKGPGWYYWDESEAFCNGPYPSKEEAELHRDKYFIWLNGGSLPG